MWPSRAGRWIWILAITALFPLGVSQLGALIVWATPPSYRSTVLVRVGPEVSDAADLLLGGEVGREARHSLKRAAPAAHSGGVWVRATEAPEWVTLEAHGASPEESLRRSLAYARAFEHYVERTGESASTGVPWRLAVDGDRVSREDSADHRFVLGIGVLASFGLLLAIPFLNVVERVLPVRVA